MVLKEVQLFPTIYYPLPKYILSLWISSIKWKLICFAAVNSFSFMYNLFVKHLLRILIAKCLWAIEVTLKSNFFRQHLIWYSSFFYCEAVNWYPVLTCMFCQTICLFGSASLFSIISGPDEYFIFIDVCE